MALAYFITFTTYGTWLHGSAKGRGSVDNGHNQYGSPFVEPDAEREYGARQLMTQSPYVMQPTERNVVCQAIVPLCEEKGWELYAAHVRSNHVHVVVSADREPGRLMSDLKARASRDLARAGYGDAERRRWTRHGSTKHLFSQNQVDEKVDYTLNGQGARMAWFAKEPRTQ